MTVHKFTQALLISPETFAHSYNFISADCHENIPAYNLLNQLMLTKTVIIDGNFSALLCFFKIVSGLLTCFSLCLYFV